MPGYQETGYEPVAYQPNKPNGQPGQAQPVRYRPGGPANTFDVGKSLMAALRQLQQQMAPPPISTNLNANANWRAQQQQNQQAYYQQQYGRNAAPAQPNPTPPPVSATQAYVAYQKRLENASNAADYARIQKNWTASQAARQAYPAGTVTTNARLAASPTPNWNTYQTAVDYYGQKQAQEQAIYIPPAQQAASGGGGDYGYGGGSGGGYAAPEPSIPRWLYGMVSWRYR